MALFRRSRAELYPPDEDFPFFAADEAQRFREVVRSTLAEMGLEVTVHRDHVVDSDGRRFGLSNLAVSCHSDDRGERGWPEWVRRHIGTLLRSLDAPDPFETMSRGELLDHTYLRVLPEEDVLPTMGYRSEVGPGLYEVVQLDLPETVASYTDARIERHGPLEELRAAGLANLRGTVPDEHEEFEHAGGSLRSLEGDSMFIASLLLILPEVVARYGPPPDPELGVFVGAPHRHQVVFHPVRDASAVPSLQLVVQFTELAHRASHGPVSPHVYWSRPSGLEQLTVHTPDGAHLAVRPELAEILERLTG